MDLNGVWASVNFPSQITGFCGSVFFGAADRELGRRVRARVERLAVRGVVRARIPTRIVPLGITYLADPALAAAEIRRNAARGFTLGDASRSGRTRSACRRCGTASTGTRSSRRASETDTVISLHVGSSGSAAYPAGCARAASSRATLFGQLSLGACAEWLWSEYPVRHPNLEDRDERGRHRLGRDAARPARLHRRPLELRRSAGPSGRPTCCKRNFWFCTLEDPSTIDTRHRIGVENIMVEVDYPHGDSTWPDTQLVIEQAWGHIPPPSSARCAARTRPRSTATRCRRSCSRSTAEAIGTPPLKSTWPVDDRRVEAAVDVERSRR